MARRGRDEDWIWAVAQSIGLLVALGLVYPPFRQVVVGVGSTFVCLLILSVMTVFGVGAYRFLSRREAPEERSGVEPSGPGVLGVDNPPTTEQFIDQLRAIDWFQFEQLVGLLYREQGYAVARRGGANPDGGIDLVIEKDGTRTAVQCKHWKTWNVGVRAVREFLGALTDAGIQRGLFITLGGYTGEAKQLADKHGIEVVNEIDLAIMLKATDARFDSALQEILGDRRKFCPKCEREMVLRTAVRGRGAGQQFWGCSGYPSCRFTMPASEGSAGVMRLGTERSAIARP